MRIVEIVKENPNTPNREQRRKTYKARVRYNSVETCPPFLKEQYKKRVASIKLSWMLKQTKHSKILTNKVKEYLL